MQRVGRNERGSRARCALFRVPRIVGNAERPVDADGDDGNRVAMRAEVKRRSDEQRSRTPGVELWRVARSPFLKVLRR